MKTVIVVVVSLLLLQGTFGAVMPPYCGVTPFSDAAAFKRTQVPPLGSHGSGSTSTVGMNLVHVQVVMRHGDRTADAGASWKPDPAVFDCELGWLEYTSFDLNIQSEELDRVFRLAPINNREELAGNCLLGQLTTQGYLQHINNGEVFRQAYVGPDKLLPETFNDSLVYLRSDDMPRTQQSIQGMFFGLYPPSTMGPNMTIVDLHTMDETTDNLNPNGFLCDDYYTYMDDYSQSEAAKQIYLNYTLPAETALNATLKEADVEVTYPYGLFDSYYTHVCHGFEVPGGADNPAWEAATQATFLSFKGMTQYPDYQTMGRVSMGPFIKELWQNLQVAINGTNLYKFQAYCTHDTSVMPFLAALGLIGDEWCPYAGYVVWELYESQVPAPSAYISEWSYYYVRVIRYGEEVVVPGCSSILCPLEEFYNNVLVPVIPTDTQCKGV